MADLPEHKEGGDDGKPNTAVPLKNESSGLQCASLGVCGENPQPSKESTLLHSTSEKHQSGGVSLHPVEAKDAKSSEEASDHPVKLRVKDGSETNAFTKQDEMASSFDESKLAKTSVSQAKDPPDKEIAQGEGNMLVIEQNESLPQESDSKEVLSVSTNSSETSVTLNNSTSAVCEAVRTGDVLKEFHTPTEAGTFSAVECQESKPTSLSTVKSPCLDTPSFAPRITPEKLIEPPADSQGSSKSSISFASLETSGIEGSSTQSSSMSSASDLCSASEIEPIVIDSPSHPSLLAPASKSFSAPTLSNSVQQESGNEMTLLVNQSLVNKAQCPQEYLCAESKSEDKVGGENAGAIIEEGKRDFECMVLDSSGNMTGQSEMRVKEKESCIDVDLTNETDSLTLPLIVATHSLSHLQDAEESTEKGEPTVLVSAEKKIVPSLESEPLRPVTIGSSLQPLELIQEVSVMESTPITTDMAIIESSADEADSIGGLVINNVIGAADGVVDFHPDDVETEKELTDISASTPQLVEGSDLSDEHGPSVKRRRLENGPNGVDDKSNSAKKVHFKVIPVKNGHGVWDSQKLQEVLISKGTILLQIHLSKESMELFQPDKDDRKIDFTAIMAETKDDDHDHVLSFGHVEPGDDPLSVAANPPSYERPFTPSHRGSTALQPAMSRPGFKHLQTPQQYLMKNEVLGLPPPLEFEDPQMGTPDWSGMDARTVAFPEFQASPHSPIVESHSSGPKSKISREKVCPECGKVFGKNQTYSAHMRSHRPPLNCDVCSYKTKNPKRLRWHKFAHKKENPENECDSCHRYFVTNATLRLHERKTHHIYVCRYCHVKYSTDEELKNHLQRHGKVPGYMDLKEINRRKPQTTDEVSAVYKSQFTCHFCKKVSRTSKQFKFHLSQHLGIPWKDIDDQLLANHGQLFNVNNDSRVELETPVSTEATIFGAAVKHEVISEVADISDKMELLPPVSSTLFEPSSESLGQTLLISNDFGQPLSVMRSSTALQSPTTSTTNELARPELIPTACKTSLSQLSTTTSTLSDQTLLICNQRSEPHFLLGSPAYNATNEMTVSPYTHNMSAVCVPFNKSTIQYSTTPVEMSPPEIAAGTSFSSNSQTTAAEVLIPLQEQPDDTSFGTHSNLKQHTLNTHPVLTIPDPYPLVTTHKDVLPMKLAINGKSQKCNPKIDLKPLPKKMLKEPISCDVCGEYFDSRMTLSMHKRKHRKLMICLECNNVCRDSRKMMQHQKQHHKDKYRCRFGCGFLSDTYTEIIDHYSSVHDKDYSRIECPHCQRSFLYKSTLLNHLEKCKECPPDQRPGHVCGNCEGFFPNVKTYHYHTMICLPSVKKKDQSKNYVYENVARESGEGTSQSLAESTADNLEKCEDASDGDSDTDNSGSSFEIIYSTK